MSTETIEKRLLEVESNQNAILDSLNNLNNLVEGAFVTISEATVLGNQNVDEINALRETVSENTNLVSELKRSFESFSSTTKEKLTQLENTSTILQRDMNEKVLPEIESLAGMEGDGTNDESENIFVGDNQEDIINSLS